MRGFFLKAAADKAAVCFDFPSLDGREQTIHILLQGKGNTRSERKDATAVHKESSLKLGPEFQP